MKCIMHWTKLFADTIQRNFYRNFHLARIKCAHTHYDTLKLTQNCSVKEIRDAFIKLSKQCHPDCNQNDPKTHSQFVKLNEAYSVLSRPDKRKAYDKSLIIPDRYQYQHHHQHHHHQQQHHSASYAKVHYEEADGKSRSSSHDSNNYYGIRGLKRVSNATIALLCIAVASVGVILQVVAIRMSLTFSRKKLDVKSHKARLILAKVQEDAEHHGNERQLELLRERVISSGVDVPPFDFGKERVVAVEVLGNVIVPADAEVAEETVLRQAL